MMRLMRVGSSTSAIVPPALRCTKARRASRGCQGAGRSRGVGYGPMPIAMLVRGRARRARRPATLTLTVSALLLAGTIAPAGAQDDGGIRTPSSGRRYWQERLEQDAERTRRWEADRLRYELEDQRRRRQ